MKESMRRSLPTKTARPKNAFDESCSFCLFRIPKKGGRVIWQVTNQCNYRCSYCIFSADFRKPEGELTTAHFLTHARRAQARGFTHLKVTGGEPFIRPDMLEILGYAHQLGFETDISSNASMITRRIAEGIAAAEVATVHVSLDGPTKELQSGSAAPALSSRPCAASGRWSPPVFTSASAASSTAATSAPESDGRILRWSRRQ